MTQDSLPYVPDSDTSKAAAESMQDVAGGLERRVYEHIVSRGAAGATDDEVEQALGLSHQTASARRRALVQKHRVRDSGERRPTRSGRKATVWVAVQEPEQGRLL